MGTYPWRTRRESEPRRGRVPESLPEPSTRVTQFDIYIQGKLELKDFNIAAEAKGNGKGIVKSFVRSVRNDYVPPTDDDGGGLSTAAIVGIVVAVLVVLLLLVAFIWWKFCLQKIKMADELRGLDLQTGSFTLRQLKAATNHFDPANKIGEGGFAPVFKPTLKIVNCIWTGQ